jgi:hypothetical protein
MMQTDTEEEENKTLCLAPLAEHGVKYPLLSSDITEELHGCGFTDFVYMHGGTYYWKTN